MSTVKGNRLGQVQMSVIAVCQFLALTCCGLRLWARRIVGVQLALNDYLLLSALFWVTALGVCGYVSVIIGGAGLHMRSVTKAEVVALEKMFIPGALFWALANSSVKLSMIHFYLRLFPDPMGHFRRIAQFIGLLVICYCLMTILETFLICRPLKYNWDKTVKGSCGDIQTTYLTAGIVNLVLDVAIIVLPLPRLWQLQMPLLKKAGITVMLSIGLFICVVTVFRIISIRQLDPENFNHTAAMVQIWSLLEPYLAIVVACIPVMVPAVRRIFCIPKAPTTTKNSKPSLVTIGGGNSNWSSNGDKKQFRRLHDVSYQLQSIDQAPHEPVGNKDRLEIMKEQTVVLESTVAR